MNSNEPLYYVIVYRPKGSRTWTPVDLSYLKTGNFFASEARAEERLLILYDTEYQDNEYRVAKVLLVGPETGEDS